MKKYLALLLSILLIFALCACGDNSNETEPTESADPTESTEPVEGDDVEGDDDADVEGDDDADVEGDDDTDADDSGAVSDPLSPEALSAELGVDLIVPEGAENTVWTKDGETAQLSFRLDGKDYCFRAKKTDSAENVSGVDVSGSEVDNSNEEFTMYLSGKSGVVTWFYDGVSFAVYMASGADFDELLIIHDMLIP